MLPLYKDSPNLSSSFLSSVPDFLFLCLPLVNFISFYKFFFPVSFPESYFTLNIISVSDASIFLVPLLMANVVLLFLSFSSLLPDLQSLPSCFLSLSTMCHGYSFPWLLNQHLCVKYSFSLFSSYNLPTLSNTSHHFLCTLDHLPLAFTVVDEHKALPRHLISKISFSRFPTGPWSWCHSLALGCQEK